MGQDGRQTGTGRDVAAQTGQPAAQVRRVTPTADSPYRCSPCGHCPVNCAARAAQPKKNAGPDGENK